MAIEKFEVRNRFSGKVQFTAKIETALGMSPRVKLGLAVRWAQESGADLRGADLRDAYLSGAYLRGAYLGCADLRGAYLSDADLRDADLRVAYLRGAYLGCAYFSGADLRCADLSGADLRGADLRGAYLGCADLRGADLSDADFRDAYFSGAYLRGADLSGAKNIKLPHFQLPDGDLIGWKALAGGVICKLRIPPEARRTASVNGRKCRAEYAEVLEGEGFDKHTGRTEYRVGQIVRPDSYDDDPFVECTNGIHFFATREEAEEWA